MCRCVSLPISYYMTVHLAGREQLGGLFQAADDNCIYHQVNLKMLDGIRLSGKASFHYNYEFKSMPGIFLMIINKVFTKKSN
ncbi:hypothetical protein GCM10028778_07190 [Barrientosiimonas marina]